jgi:hypothetical protein
LTKADIKRLAADGMRFLRSTEEETKGQKIRKNILGRTTRPISFGTSGTT